MEMTTEEKNILIAEFMGDDFMQNVIVPMLAHHYPSPEEMRFSDSWEWLMPVVEKIENHVALDATITIELDNCSAIYGIDQKFHAASYSKIESTFEVVVYILKWYNQNK